MVLTQTTFETLLQPYIGRGREALLPILWDVQTAFGYISPEAVQSISYTLRVPEAEIFGVIGFYSLFYNEPTARRIVRVCTSPTCAIDGGHHTLERMCQHLKVSAGQPTDDGETLLEATECLGLCDQSPAVLVSTQGQGESLHAKVYDGAAFLDNPQAFSYQNIFRSDVGILIGNSTSPQPHYHALAKALAENNPDGLIETVQQSGLIGRGGAAFPTGLKWKFTRATQSFPKYVVCNADESEPGTFKDRVLMEENPHLLLEGLAIAAYAIGANKAYIFIRGEYPEATRILQQAIDDAVAHNWLGDAIQGSAFSLDVEIRRGAGAYVCGEETALFEAIEGKRGFPRIKPPYPTTNGLFDKPTVVNNVETLCNVPSIVLHGADAYKHHGTEKSTGTKVISISGSVRQPGVVEINPGLTLRTLLDEYCGGVIGELQAVLMGGAAGVFMTPAEVDVPLTFEDLRAVGSTFGSGAIMVFNREVDLVEVLQSLGHFFKHESCGKCFPCQLGTQRQHEILHRLRAPIAGDAIRLADIGMTMTEASICGLGQTAATAVLSALKKFPHLFME